MRCLSDHDVTVNFLRSRLNSPQSCGFFERVTFNFMVSRSCIRFFNPEVIHGGLFERTRFLLKGA